MSERVLNVLFLCTGNSARSILGEAILNHRSKGRFRAHSAGSHPKGEVNSFALDLLRELKMPTKGLRSKSWDEFAVAGAPRMDFIFTVCDQAAGETCPAWPGQPVSAHWGLPDPAAVEGSVVERRLAFHQAFAGLEARIRIFIDLPFRTLDLATLQAKLDMIGRPALSPESHAADRSRIASPAFSS